MRPSVNDSEMGVVTETPMKHLTEAVDRLTRSVESLVRLLNHYSRSRGAKMGNLYKEASMPTVFSNALVARMPREQNCRAVAIGQEEASDLDSA